MSAHQLRLRNIELDLDQHLATRDGDCVALTATEWKLIGRLAEDPGRLVLSTELISSVWGDHHSGDSAYLRVWISRLRRKLEPTPGEAMLIKTMQGVGYMLDAQSLD